MRFFIDSAEERAIKYVRTYIKHSIFTRVVVIQLSKVVEMRENTRTALNDYFRQILEDPRSLVFYLSNKDVLIFSDKMTNHHVFKMLRHFGLNKIVETNVYKLPHDGVRVEEMIAAYVYNRKVQDLPVESPDFSTSKRDRFMGLKINDELAYAIAKVRAARQDGVVLVVDDDPFATNLISSSICKTHRVVQAHDGIEGFKKYAHLAPDIIFLDINMPSVSGFDFLAKIFQLDPHAYVVIISGEQSASSEEKARLAGAKGFIRKPFSKNALYHYIHQANHAYA